MNSSQDFSCWHRNSSRKFSSVGKTWASCNRVRRRSKCRQKLGTCHRSARLEHVPQGQATAQEAGGGQALGPTQLPDPAFLESHRVPSAGTQQAVSGVAAAGLQRGLGYDTPEPCSSAGHWWLGAFLCSGTHSSCAHLRADGTGHWAGRSTSEERDCEYKHREGRKQKHIPRSKEEAH